MEGASGFELSLLEGMDASLLTRLHAAGIRTRDELGERIATPEGRSRLARELDVPPRQVEVLHHLNFVLPEDRAARLLDLEQRSERFEGVAHGYRRLQILAAGAALLAFLSLAGVVVLLLRPAGDPGPSSAKRLEALESKVESLVPLGAAQAEERIVRELSKLGPAPGWGEGLSWTEADHRQIDGLLAGDPSRNPPRALSLALARLHAIETAAPDSLGPAERGRQATALLGDFPPVTRLDTMWDAAAVLVRARIRSRAFGLDPSPADPPPSGAALPWEWTSPAFLTCEEILTRLEALSVKGDAVATWSGALVQLRGVADLGRADFAGRSQAFARDYWIRRGELELAVAAGLAGRSSLIPYSASAPRTFVEERKRYLQATLFKAPAEARAALAWLVVEYDEALALFRWIGAHAAPADTGNAWIEALAAAEAERHPAAPPDSQVTQSVARALAVFGETGDPWASPRTLREASLRPLLMEVRAATRRR